jgi:tol-pal system protein YbgF
MKKDSIVLPGRFPVLAVLSLAILLGACASKSDLEALQRQMRSTRVETDQRLTDMDSRLGEKVQPVQERQAQSWNEVELLKTRLGQLQNQVDSLTASQQTVKNANLPELSRQVEAMRLALSSQLGIEIAGPETPEGNAAKAAIATDHKAPAAGPATAPAPAPAPAAAPAPAPKAEAKAPSKDAAEILYDRALEAFKNKKYDDAQSYFQEFYSSFPNNQLTPNAMFWRGESFYQMGRYPEATLEYENVKNKFPKSDKLPAAMLKQGMSLVKMNQKDAGKFVLDDLVKKFPNSPEAKRAKTFLQSPS